MPSEGQTANSRRLAEGRYLAQQGSDYGLPPSPICRATSV